MMDLKEIIRWFIPCFNLLSKRKIKMNSVLTFLCVFLFFNCCAGMSMDQGVYSAVSSDVESRLGKIDANTNQNLAKSASVSENLSDNNSSTDTTNTQRSLKDVAVGRTFGRPFKKMMGALIPLIFQIGAASTWAVVAALVGIKTLAVTLFILKLLLVAGAAKVGALFASKGHKHESHGWEPPHQKEIHLHIHNGQPHEHHEEHVAYSPWNREGFISASPSSPEAANHVFYKGGPQTISTPFGNYVKIDPTS